MYSDVNSLLIIVNVNSLLIIVNVNSLLIIVNINSLLIIVNVNSLNLLDLIMEERLIAVHSIQRCNHKQISGWGFGFWGGFHRFLVHFHAFITGTDSFRGLIPEPPPHKYAHDRSC